MSLDFGRRRAMRRASILVAATALCAVYGPAHAQTARQLPEPADHDGGAAAGRRNRGSPVPARRRTRRRGPQAAGDRRESPGRRRRPRRDRGGDALRAGRPHGAVRAAAVLHRRASAVREVAARHPRDGAGERARGLSADSDRARQFSGRRSGRLHRLRARPTRARSTTDTRARAIPAICSAS